MNKACMATKLNILQCQMLRYTANEGRSIRVMTETVEGWIKDIREIEIELRGQNKVEDNSY